MRAVVAAVLTAVSVATIAPFATREAFAAPKDAELAEARTRFQQALALQSGGDWAGALALLDKVAAVAPTPQVRFNVALCQEKLGKLSAALGNYRIAATAARETKAADVEKQATAKVAEIEGRLPKLVVTRGANASAAAIVVDGTELGTAAIGAELPIDPGPHQIEARPRGGGKPTVVVVQIAEGEKKAVVANLEEEIAAPAGPPTAPPPAKAEDGSGGGPNALVYAGFGLAIVGVAVGSVTGILMFSKKSDLDAGCSANKECPPDAHDDLSGAKTMATISTISFIAAGVGVGIGVFGLVTKKSSAPATTGSIEPFIGFGSGGVHGSF